MKKLNEALSVDYHALDVINTARKALRGEMDPRKVRDLRAALRSQSRMKRLMGSGGFQKDMNPIAVAFISDIEKTTGKTLGPSERYDINLYCNNIYSRSKKRHGGNEESAQKETFEKLLANPKFAALYGVRDSNKELANEIANDFIDAKHRFYDVEGIDIEAWWGIFEYSVRAYCNSQITGISNKYKTKELVTRKLYDALEKHFTEEKINEIVTNAEQE